MMLTSLVDIVCFKTNNLYILSTLIFHCNVLILVTYYFTVKTLIYVHFTKGFSVKYIFNIEWTRYNYHETLEMMQIVPKSFF
jgi:hypothetical protein